MRAVILVLVCVAVSVAAAAGAEPVHKACALTIDLVDAETRASRPGLVRFKDADGKAVKVAEPLLNRGVGMGGSLLIASWSVLIEPSTVKLPQRKFTVEAISGLETERAEVPIDLRGKATAEVAVPLRTFHAARAKGLRSGNTHLHLMRFRRALADRYLLEIPKADGLDVVFPSYLERINADIGYISNRYSTADLARLSQSGVLFGNGEEHRHNLAGYGQGFGHVMLLDIGRLVYPVSIGPGIMKSGTDGIPIQRGIDAARRDGATIIWCHNSWGTEDIPNWLTGRLQAQNIFDGGSHGSYKNSFYRYLNAGLRVPFSTGTDWFIYDFSRVYVPIEGELTVKRWLAALRAGRSYITNGPFFEFRVGDADLGETVALDRPGQVEITGHTVGRIDFERIELVQNGRVVHTTQSRAEAGHFVADMKTSVRIDKPCWLALRTPPPPVKDDPDLQNKVPLNELGGPLFGHTSPIYVEVAGEKVFDRGTAESLLAEMRENRRFVNDKARFANDNDRAGVLAVYDEAMKRLRQRLAE